MSRINLNGFSVSFKELEAIMAMATDEITRDYGNDFEFRFNINKDYFTATKLVDGEYWLHPDYVDDNQALLDKLYTALAGE